MKNISYTLILLIGIISSCKTSNNVVSNFGIQKRKYTKGWFYSKPKINTKSTATINKSHHDSIRNIKFEAFIIPNVTVSNNQVTVEEKIIKNLPEKVSIKKKIKKKEITKTNIIKKVKINKLTKTPHKKHKVETNTNTSSNNIEYEDLNNFFKYSLLVLGVLLITSIILTFAYFALTFEVLVILGVIPVVFIPILVGYSFQFSEIFPFGKDYWSDVFAVSGWVLGLACLIYCVSILITFTVSQWLVLLLAILILLAIVALLAALLTGAADALGLF